MTRLKKIQSMSAEQLAEVLMETGMDDNIDFCRCDQECDDDVPEGRCQQCLVAWLEEDLPETQEPPKSDWKQAMMDVFVGRC